MGLAELAEEAASEIERNDRKTVDDLWELAVYTRGGACFDVGYFLTMEDAKTSAEMISEGRRRWFPTMDYHGGTTFAMVYPDEITAFELGHPYMYEVVRRKRYLPEGYARKEWFENVH